MSTPKSTPNISAVILAAGKGTRMKSDQAKVLHELFFKPMLHHVLDSVAATDIGQIAVIVGHQRKQVLASLQEAPTPYNFTPVVQEEQLGTGHAVLCAESACASADLVMILCGDTPLIRPETLQAMIDRHQESKSVLTLMTTVLDDPFGYGRIITDEEDGVVAIVEQKDASAEQRAFQEVNAGIYLVDADFLFSALQQVGTDNSQGEVYLTDIVSIATKQGHRVEKFVHTPAIDVLGVNSRVELAQAHSELQMRHNREVMLSGVTMYCPESILISPDCQIGQDCVVQAGAHITGGSIIGKEVQLASGAVLYNCQIGDNAVIGANSVLQNCIIEDGAVVPPLTLRMK
ncbi:MAG: bifunctional N-acetylglucosamine-1-phosphate uridyltransferase/glucosamine-1-phosphate acetyltransferase [Candidatus Electrothrix sp. AX5]|nr:bifunctional N-acetylglucosamine-1-phosphate uridyltransferase/glucosamine-1-phosphate acetyltransferase [Candidatus Electrothrix sp. AX5]